jgi:hypothetical protein
MKFLKKTQLNFRNVSDNSVAVIIDAPNNDGVLRDPRVVMEVTNSLLVPKGTEAQRPDSTVWENGMVRYNTESDEFEFRQGGQWRKVSYKEPTLITQQGPLNGDDVELYFGPLDSGNADYSTPELANPQNILVFVENVFQLAVTNYTLVDNPPGTPSAAFYLGAATYPAGRYVKFDSAVPFGKPVTVIHGFDR